MKLPKFKSPVSALDNILKIAGFIMAIIAILKFAREEFAKLDTGEPEAQPVENGSKSEISEATDSRTTGKGTTGGK